MKKLTENGRENLLTVIGLVIAFGYFGILSLVRIVFNF